MTARFLIGDVFDRLAGIPDGTVDLVVTSPPFLALRSYLPADHPDKGKEIGSEANPAQFIDTLLALTSEWGRVLAPHGSIAVELGDTYSGSGGAGGDYLEDGLRDGQPKFKQNADRYRGYSGGGAHETDDGPGTRVANAGGPGWPLAKCKSMIPELYRVALAYGTNPLTGQPSPAGRWRVRNVVTWCRPNPPVGALGDKWRPATSDIVIACISGKRYWDDLATRRPGTSFDRPEGRLNGSHKGAAEDRERVSKSTISSAGLPLQHHPSGAPLLDYWVIPPGGYQGAHYAVYPPALVEPLIQAMAPPKVCVECGEPARRIVDHERTVSGAPTDWSDNANEGGSRLRSSHGGAAVEVRRDTLGWTSCGHDNYRPAHILDPFAGSGTTLAVATGHGHTATGIDIDERNADLALNRVGPMLLEVEGR